MDAVLRHRGEDGGGAANVDIGVVRGVLHVHAQSHLRREMAHHVGVANEATDDLGIAYVADRDVRSRPGGACFEHANVVAAFDQLSHDMTADEAAAAGHDNAHR